MLLGSRALGLFMVVVASLLSAQSGLGERPEPAGALAAGTPAETPYYVIDSGQAGPRIVIVSGVHGDELSGPVAADQMRHWPILRGKLAILPRANVLALKANSRLTPLTTGTSISSSTETNRNLNRVFPPGKGVAGNEHDLPAEIWSWLKEFRPDWLLDLHEGAKFHIESTNSVGSTVIASLKPSALKVADLMVKTLNESVAATNHKFLLLRNPMKGTLVRAVADEFGTCSLIVETTQQAQSVGLRTRQQRIAVRTFLRELGIVADDVTAESIIGPAEKAGRIAVGVYDGPGNSGAGVPSVLKQMGGQSHLVVARLCPDDIRAGALRQFDVVMFTGGSGSGQAKALGQAGRREVQRFVADGGGYVGICAGSYLACSGFEWGLSLINARTVSPLWQRGKGQVDIELTSQGLEVLGGPAGKQKCLYAQGPIVGPAGVDRLACYEVFAWFRSEVAANNTPKGIMVDSPASFGAAYGKGRVLCFSPHPEQTGGMEEVVPRAVRWVASGAPSSVSNGQK